MPLHLGFIRVGIKCQHKVKKMHGVIRIIVSKISKVIYIVLVLMLRNYKCMFFRGSFRVVDQLIWSVVV